MFKGNKKKTFFAAMIMLLVSAIVITSASFAWFALGKNAAVTNIDVTVTAKEGIAISANTTNFTEVITYANLTSTETDSEKSKFNAASDNQNYFCERIKPASTLFNVSSGLPTFVNGGIETKLEKEGDSYAAKRVLALSAIEEGKDKSMDGVFAFDVYIKAGVATVVNTDKSEIAVKSEAADEAAVDENVAKAFRVGFVNVDDNDGCIFAIDNTAKNTKAIGTAGDYEVSDGALVSASGSSYAKEAGVKGVDATSASQLSLKAGTNHIRVYIWMEGQDPNFVDTMASQQLSVNLIFDTAA